MKMKKEIIVQNLKCGGCASTITKGVESLEGIENVSVDVDSSTISFTTDLDNIEFVHEKLAKMGYPVDGDTNSIGQKAKSFVSCAVGKMNS